MTLLPQTHLAATVDAVENIHPDVETKPPQAPVLITEQEVMLGTAAAVPLPRTGIGRRFAQALQRILAASLPSPRPQRPHYPARRDWLEDSRMAREMLRL